MMYCKKCRQFPVLTYLVQSCIAMEKILELILEEIKAAAEIK
jgi:hypothetical protein